MCHHLRAGEISQDDWRKLIGSFAFTSSSMSTSEFRWSPNSAFYPCGRWQGRTSQPICQPCDASEDLNEKLLHTDTDDLGQENSQEKKRKRRLCEIFGCQNAVVNSHRCKRHGAKKRVCMVEGCEKPVKQHNKCSMHGPPRKRCEVDECKSTAVRKGLCTRHLGHASI